MSTDSAYFYVRLSDLRIQCKFILSPSGTSISWHLVNSLLIEAEWYICVSKQAITGPDNGLSSGQYQAIIWTNAGILLIRTLGTNLSGITSEIDTFSIKKVYLKISSTKWKQFCLCFNELIMTSKPSVLYWWVVSLVWSSLVRIICCHLLSTKPLPKTILTYCLVDSQ